MMKRMNLVGTSAVASVTMRITSAAALKFDVPSDDQIGYSSLNSSILLPLILWQRRMNTASLAAWDCVQTVEMTSLVRGTWSKPRSQILDLRIMKDLYVRTLYARLQGLDWIFILIDRNLWISMTSRTYISSCFLRYLTCLTLSGSTFNYIQPVHITQSLVDLTAIPPSPLRIHQSEGGPSSLARSLVLSLWLATLISARMFSPLVLSVENPGIWPSWSGYSWQW